MLVVEDSIRPLDLRTLQFEKLETYMGYMIGNAKITRGRNSTLWDRNHKMRTILTWLWEVAVSPVLQNLGLCPGRPGETLSRVWWIANGIMGLAPIHAAGLYNDKGKSSECTSRYVVSSYIPSLKALEFFRKRELTRLDRDFLVVPVPSTPGYDNLSALAEVDTIKKGIEPTEPNVLGVPRKSKVLEALRTCRIAHFASHRVHNPMDPPKGSLLLPGDTIGAVDHLTVQELVSSSHNHA